MGAKYGNQNREIQGESPYGPQHTRVTLIIDPKRYQQFSETPPFMRFGAVEMEGERERDTERAPERQREKERQRERERETERERERERGREGESERERDREGERGRGGERERDFAANSGACLLFVHEQRQQYTLPVGRIWNAS